MIDYQRELDHAEILISQERFAQAESKLETVLSQYAEDSVALQFMAIAKMGLEKWEEARQLLHILIAKHPG